MVSQEHCQSLYINQFEGSRNMGILSIHSMLCVRARARVGACVRACMHVGVGVGVCGLQHGLRVKFFDHYCYNKLVYYITHYVGRDVAWPFSYIKPFT